VRIIEHCFLQPVWTEANGLNFELSIFLFPKNNALYKSPKFPELEAYTKELIRGLVPAQIIPNIHWIDSRKDTDSFSLTSLETLLKEAYPPKKTFYFDTKITASQEKAMQIVAVDWVYYQA